MENAAQNVTTEQKVSG